MNTIQTHEGFFLKNGKKGESMITFKSQFQLRSNAKNFGRKIKTHKMIIVDQMTLKTEKVIKITLLN